MAYFPVAARLPGCGVQRGVGGFLSPCACQRDRRARSADRLRDDRSRARTSLATLAREPATGPTDGNNLVIGPKGGVGQQAHKGRTVSVRVCVCVCLCMCAAGQAAIHLAEGVGPSLQ